MPSLGGTFYSFYTSPMNPVSTKGLLKVAALAIAGAAALGAGSANATACANGTLGNLASGCTFNGLTLTLSNIGDAEDQINFTTTPGFFRINPANSGDGSSFTFTLTAPNPEFITGFEFRGPGGTVAGTTPDFFSVSSSGPANVNIGPGTVFSFPYNNIAFNNANYGTIIGTYTYSSANTALGAFTTDVPLPLPIVGAGLAFRFTRKLRSRAKLHA
jgi:hypothetical protein